MIKQFIRFFPRKMRLIDYIGKKGAHQIAINPRRRAERAEMEKLGFKNKKAYRKWQKHNRRQEREK